MYGWFYSGIKGILLLLALERQENYVGPFPNSLTLFTSLICQKVAHSRDTCMPLVQGRCLLVGSSGEKEGCVGTTSPRTGPQDTKICARGSKRSVMEEGAGGHCSLVSQRWRSSKLEAEVSNHC